MWNYIHLLYFLLSIYDRKENTENPIFFNKFLDELELFNYKKLIFDEKKIPSVCQQIL
jgi:hypothetical protein